MDNSILRDEWCQIGPALQRTFRHIQIPDIPPHGPLWDRLLTQMALSHDLTRAEVLDIIEDTSLRQDVRIPNSQAA